MNTKNIYQAVNGKGFHTAIQAKTGSMKSMINNISNAYKNCLTPYAFYCFLLFYSSQRMLLLSRQ